MLRFSLLFSLGVLLFHQLPELPPWPWLSLLAALALACSRLRLQRPWLALLLGFGWSHAYALVTQPTVLAVGGVARATIDARVVSLVSRAADTARFVVETDRVAFAGGNATGHWRFRLSWRNAPAIVPGETWRLPVRLRAAHGYATPGAWDYEGWLYWQGVRYIGYVEPDHEAQRLTAESCCRLHRVRAHLATAVDALAAPAFTRGVMKALTIGDTSGLDAAAKGLFRDTGTSHLIAISGLHIGLLAGLGMVAVTSAWRRLPRLCRRVPAVVAGVLAGSVLAAGYAALAGMALPTQRALLMLLVFTAGLVMRRDGSRLRALALAAVGVLLWHPPSVVEAGFWLSFGAVLAILAVLAWSRAAPRWRVAIMVQSAVSLALWPVLSLFGMPSSAASPLVNLVLVPVFGLVVVPWSLSGVLLLAVDAGIGAVWLRPLVVLLDLMRQGMEAVAALPWPDVAVPAAGPEVVSIAVAVILLLLPPGIPLRWLAVPLLCVPWLPREPTLRDGEFALHLLDVGQGLSAVVETRHHTLVFDTGPEFSTGFNTAEAVLRPFLRRRGRSAIDRLILSHGDKDHAGGVDQLLGALAVSDLQSGEPARVGRGARPCAAGERWQWDGVAFEFLHPPRGDRLAGNNASCVLRVGNTAGSVLLTGDIEAAVERRLSQTVADRLNVDVVVAPHHGSRSSSSAAFVAATRPGFVVYTAGWANRYGFPARHVDRRWRGSGARTLNTADSGAIGFRFAADGRILGPSAYRDEARRFWWHTGGSAAPPLAVSSADRTGGPRAPP